MLFLDEVTEFHRDALEGLRQPLEDGRIVLARAAGTVQFPARFSLVAAANPCPCGFDGDGRRRCRCGDHRIEVYRQRLSGPLLDRIDLQLRIPRLTKGELLGAASGEASAAVRERVELARARQLLRLAGTPWTSNAGVPGPVARRTFALTPDAEGELSSAVDALALSGRGFDRMVKVARTCADLAGRDEVGREDVMRALGFRTAFPEREVALVG